MSRPTARPPTDQAAQSGRRVEVLRRIDTVTAAAVEAVVRCTAFLTRGALGPVVITKVVHGGVRRALLA